MLMPIIRRTVPLIVASLIALAPGPSSEAAPGAVAYTVSMPQPSNHLFHVTLRVDGLKGEFHDVKMPAWHPGYYRMIDYAKFFASAGLEVTTASADAPGAYLGLNMQTRDGKLVVVGASAGSPAERAGLAAGDQILEVDGVSATPTVLNDTLSVRKPGETTTLKVSRNNAGLELRATLARNSKQTFTIRPVASPTVQQKAILDDWLRRVLN